MGTLAFNDSSTAFVFGIQNDMTLKLEKVALGKKDASRRTILGRQKFGST